MRCKGPCILFLLSMSIFNLRFRTRVYIILRISFHAVYCHLIKKQCSHVGNFASFIKHIEHAVCYL